MSLLLNVFDTGAGTTLTDQRAHTPITRVRTCQRGEDATWVKCVNYAEINCRDNAPTSLTRTDCARWCGFGVRLLLRLGFSVLHKKFRDLRPSTNFEKSSGELRLAQHTKGGRAPSRRESPRRPTASAAEDGAEGISEEGGSEEEGRGS